MRTVLRPVLVLAAVVFGVTAPGADDPLPNPVKTCADLRAYIDGDAMTMDRFKTLMTNAGADLSKGGNDALDMQCKLVGVVRNVVLSQRVFVKEDGTLVRIDTQVVKDGDVCKLTRIEVTGC